MSTPAGHVPYHGRGLRVDPAGAACVPPPATEIPPSPVTPAEQHTAVLDALDKAGVVPDALAAIRSGYLAGLMGRRRILDRHAPIDGLQGYHPETACTCCAFTDGDHERWPCADYRDAAAGLVDFLEPPDC